LDLRVLFLFSTGDGSDRRIKVLECRAARCRLPDGSRTADPTLVSSLPAVLFQLTSLVAGIGHLALGAWVLAEDRRARANRLFAFLSVCFFVWSVGWGMFVAAPDLETAKFWERLGLFGWLLPPALLLNLFLVITGDRREQLASWVLAAIYLPPLVLLAVNLRGPAMSDAFVRSSLGWAERLQTDSFWYWFFVVYGVGFSGLALARLWRWGRTRTLVRERRQARVMLLSGASATLLAVLLGLLPAEAPGTPLPSFGSYATIVWSLGIVYGIRRYKLMQLTPESAAQGVLRDMQEAVLLLGEQERILYANPAASRLLRRSPDELAGRHLDGVDAGGLVDLVGGLLREGPSGSDPSEHVLRFEDGREREVLLRAVQMTDEFGEPAGLALLVDDVTERSLLKRQLERADRTAERERLASVGMLAASVAHEVNNPLGYVMANLELVRDGLGSALVAASVQAGAAETRELREAVDHALDGAERVRRIVRDLGRFARVDQGDVDEPVDIPDVLEMALTLAANELRHRARVVREIEPLPAVLADEGRLCQVLLNLLVNAAQAIPPGQAEANTVTVRTWLEPEALCVEVRDSGQGIAADEVERIFEPFHTSKAQDSGAGLGLSISRRIITAMGGRISVTSELGLGSRFTVRLPSSLAVLEETPDVAATKPSAVDPLAALSPDIGSAEGPTSARALLVDDEPLLLKALARQLRRFCEVTTADSGAAAVAVLERGDPFDVIISDLMMPALSGKELYLWIRTHRPELESRVLFLTGGAFTPDLSEFVEEQAGRMLSKPVSRASLLAAVGQLLDGVGSAAATERPGGNGETGQDAARHRSLAGPQDRG
jgi:PAS domain S-box-containing protein